MERAMSDPSTWKVVVADDDTDTVRIVERLLTSHGMKVRSVGSGRECLRLIREDKPTLALVDLLMPGTSGWDVIAALRQDDALKDLLVAAMTARTEPGIRQRALSSGFNAYFAKPISPRLFLSDVVSLVENRGNRVMHSVLVVDDDAQIGHLFRVIADYLHLELTVVASAEAAFEVLRHCVPDVIVLDIFMPGIDGYQAFRHIREHLQVQDRPIVAMSAYYTSSTRQEVLAWGFNEFLSKPFDPVKLIPFLEGVVRGDSTG
jgi:two-component system cell cycle response regulator